MRAFATAPILVTGATGNTGGAVVRALLARGLPVRLAGATPARAAAAFPGVAQVRLDDRVPATFGAAIRGCRALFLVRAPGTSRTARTLLALLDAARVEGVGAVVFLSAAGAREARLLPHDAVERHLMAYPGGWTLLRPGFFAQALGDAYRRDVLLHDRLYVPAGPGRVAFVDTRDVAEVAAAALAEPAAHARRAYTLTGPVATSFAEAAAILSRALGRPIRYVPASIAGYALHLLGRGLPPGEVLARTARHVGLRSGQGEAVDPTLSLLLGRPARTLADYVRDHVALWRR